jgi:gliding motility-associated-like protein
MMKRIATAILCLSSIFCLAQNEASNWFFGRNAGIKFNISNSSVSSVSTGQISTIEGCSSISDDSGNLLFYTDGTTVYNKLHEVMDNGFGLLGDESSSQSAIVVPKPGDSNIYYVFTVGSNQRNTGLNYSVIDITLDGGLGSITNKNIGLLAQSSEKVTAVLKDCITKSIWVVSFASEDGFSEVFNTFHAFEVSDLGVSTESITSNFPIAVGDARGYLKLSPDGTKVACASVQDGLYLYDFDVNTGKVSNQISLSINSNNGGVFPYGVEFSPDSQLLYVHSSNDYFDREPGQNLANEPSSHASTLTQFNLAESNIQTTQITIEQRQLYRGALQLGPDGKIYRALSATYGEGLPYLGAINYPNELGLECGYVNNAINLFPARSSQGLPPFIASFFNTEIDIIKNGQSSINLALCDGDTYKLSSLDIPGATYTWTRDNLPITENTFDLEIYQSGHYEVYINPNNGDCAIEGQAYVQFNPNPVAVNQTILQCDEDDKKDGFTLFNLNEASNALTDNIPIRKTKFYSDAAKTKEIIGNSYANISNPQTIYVDVINTLTGCFTSCELTLKVSVTDANDVTLPAVCDDDGLEDGLYLFNLKDAENDIISGLPTGLNVSYYATYNDALLEQNNLGTNYKNRTPYSQTIFARVENANNCYGISKVTLTVNKLPNIETKSKSYYCINKSPKTITLNAGLIEDSPNNYTYNWSTGESTYEIEVNEIDTYNVTVTNKVTGCKKDRIITVEASNIASFESIDIVDATQNNTITVIASGEGIYEYALFDENNLQITSYQESNYFENIKPGFYFVHVNDIKNACGDVNKNISVIGFPKYFTPNNDGFNDTWQVYGISSMFQPNTKILIFNRYGKLIKEINPLGVGWNGFQNGQKLPADDYWFSVTLQDGRTIKDHFTLKY